MLHLGPVLQQAVTRPVNLVNISLLHLHIELPSSQARGTLYEFMVDPNHGQHGELSKTTSPNLYLHSWLIEERDDFLLASYPPERNDTTRAAVSHTQMLSPVRYIQPLAD